ncbi:hypothetical protein P7C70_g9016, partial [Phenoliferia sp. Uapishka_3]
MTTINSLPPEILHPILLHALHLSILYSHPNISPARDWGSHCRTALRLVSPYWSSILGPSTIYNVKSASNARALTSALRADPSRSKRVIELALVDPHRGCFNILELDLKELLECCGEVEVLRIHIHPNQWEPEYTKNVVRGLRKLKVLDLGDWTLLSGKMALLLESWPNLAELRTTRIVSTNSLPPSPYPNLTRISVSLINQSALLGLASFLPLCPSLTHLQIPSLDPTSPGFSRPL